MPRNQVSGKSSLSRFVFIDPIMLPPSSLIMRLHGYPRGTDSCVKKNGTRAGRERERKRKRHIEKKSCTCLIWSHVSRQINVGSSRDRARWRSHCAFYYSRDGSLIRDPPHARERRRGDTRSLFTRSFRRVRRDSRYPFHSIIPTREYTERSHPERSSVAFLKSRIPRRLYLYEELDLDTDDASIVPYPISEEFLLSYPCPFSPFSFFFSALLFFGMVSPFAPLHLARSQWLRLRGPSWNPVWMKTSDPRPEEREAGSPSFR